MLKNKVGRATTSGNGSKQSGGLSLAVSHRHRAGMRGGQSRGSNNRYVEGEEVKIGKCCQDKIRREYDRNAVVKLNKVQRELRVRVRVPVARRISGQRTVQL